MRKKKAKAKRGGGMRAERDAEMLARGCLSVTAAAAALDLSVYRVYALVGNGSLATERYGTSNAVYVTQASIDAYRARREAAAPAGLVPLEEAIRRSHYARRTIYDRAAAGQVTIVRHGTRAYLSEADVALLTGAK